MPRPTAYMVIKNLERLGVYNLENAMRARSSRRHGVRRRQGAPLCWRVGVSKWSNYVADSWDAVRRMSAADWKRGTVFQGKADRGKRRPLRDR